MAIVPLKNQDEAYWKATISWKPARKWYKDGFDSGVYLRNSLKNESGIYRFERRHGNQKNGRETLYIGIAHKQDFDTRLHQPDYLGKLKKAKAGEIWVSVGIIDLNGSSHRRERYEELENILVYFSGSSLNDKKTKWISRKVYYEVVNEGYKGPLPKYIRYPVADIIYY